MIEGRSILAIVPARGGSKGIPLKNLRTVGGRPLVARVGDVIKQVPEIDRAVVSTDHSGIARVAREADIDAPFMRPDHLSGDRIGDLEVLVHALEATEAADGKRYDIVVMLQPTSPMREPSHVSATIRKLVEENWDSVWTVSTTDTKAHPLKQLTLGPDGSLGYYDEAGGDIIARQQLAPLYHRNGIAYAITRSCLVDQRTMKGSRSAALVIDGHHISIDTEWDIVMVEFALSHQKQV